MSKKPADTANSESTAEPALMKPVETPAPGSAPENKPRKRIVFTMGGKGGVGKTGITCLLADWYAAQELPVRMIDFDVENREAAGLNHFFPEARKVDMHEKEALDEMLTILDDTGADILLVDQPAAAGNKTFQWFRDMHAAVNAQGVAMTAVGAVTGDPGSTASVLRWAAELGNRVDYLIFLNEQEQDGEKFPYWYNSDEAEEFIARARPAVIRIESRNPELENAVRNHGLTYRKIAAGGADLPPSVSATKYRLRAQGYVSRFNTALEPHAGILTA